MEEFITYFTGLKRNYGFCNIDNGYKDPESGKIKFKPGDYGWSSSPVLKQDYQDHLEGKKSIGIQPCDDDGMASFGAIDIDPDYKNFNASKYLKIIEENDLPVVPIKSKSGGLHVYVFTKTKIQASEIREFLETLLFSFGLPANTEIFPKQTKLGENADGKPINGNFINLPYFNKKERIALMPNGEEIKYEDFINIIGLNLQTKEQLKKIAGDLVKKELTGGPTEFLDGPPCLQAITKELGEGEKLPDERDRFLFNYMVFAKKKYKDNWEKKVLEAGRNYILYDDDWGDAKVLAKIKGWLKDTAGHTCNLDPIAKKCSKIECIKRPFGVASQLSESWPMLSGLTKIDYKPEPEFYINVSRPNGKVATIHAKNVKQIIEQRELKALIAAQIEVVPPPIKSKDFNGMLKDLWSNMDVLKPASGTTPREILFELTKEYLNGVQATSHNSFMTGAVLEEEGYVYFKFQPYFDDLKRNEWKKDEQRTSHMLETYFQAEFSQLKRYPGKDKNGKYFPAIRCAKLPLDIFKKEKAPEEILTFEDKEDIV
tara:strand:- start:1060 stop:2685 length:1626 start_codon:yes stop_codon:yes gene_type:complete